MKYKLHLPTEEYGFIEAEVGGQHEDAVHAYRELRQEWNGSDGLDHKEWREVLDTYLKTGNMESNAYERMSTPQKNLIQTLKKAFKRIKSKYEDNSK